MLLPRFLLLFISVGALCQNHDKILESHFKKYGQEYWDQIRTAVVDGKWTTENFTKYPIKITLKKPDKIRFEGIWGGSRFASSWNGTIGWAVEPWTGSSSVRNLLASDVYQLTNLFMFGSPLYPVRNDLKFLGLETFEQELLIHFRYDSETLTHDFYLGKSDYQLYWEVITLKGQKPETIKKQYEKYKNYSLLLAPTAVRIFTEEGVRELIFEEISLGVGANDAIFEMPRN